MTAETRALLEAFVVDNDDLERLEALLAQFNIFEALGAVRQELRHSDFLAFLLDPGQNHGLGDVFLKRFLKRVLVGTANPPLSAVEIDVVDLHEAEIRREWRHIDILILDPDNKMVCSIENKLFSRERSGQLSHYREIVTKEFPDHRRILVYLTPEGDEPSDGAYIPFSYAQIAELLEGVVRAHESTLGPDVHTSIVHYTAMLRRHIVSDSQIAELCRQIYRRHHKALDLIFEHRPDLQTSLADILKQLIQEAAGEHSLELDESVKKYIRFAVTAWDRFPAQRTAQWTPSKRILLFVFSSQSDSLVLGLFIGPGPEPVRQALEQIARDNPQAFQGGVRRFYENKWLRIHRRSILTRRDYQGAELEDLEKKIRDRWARFLGRDLPAIRKVLDEVEWPEVE